MRWNIIYVPILIIITLTTYTGAIFCERKDKSIQNKILLSAFIFLSLIPLFTFKYYNFFISNINHLIPITDQSKILLNEQKWMTPIGLSFYTFQAIGYLIDVYRNEIKAERNIISYALFVSFFPQILSGPISKARNLLPQINDHRKFDYEKAVKGLKLMLWGCFLKVVIADRIGLYIDSVYNNYIYQSGLSCLIASILYSIQIYGDFAGYSLMAIGTGLLMGFSLTNNFNRPYLAESITEFWKRWHISLTKWLTSYIYISLGGNRCSKFRNYFNILVTFLVSGIWHGANWTFIIWGIIHGILQITEKAINIPNIKSKTKFQKISRIIITFSLVNFAWIFFRMPTFNDALKVISKIIFNEGNGLFLPNNTTCGFIIMGILILASKEICEEFYPKIQLFNNNNKYIRWASYSIITIIIMLCGVFDSGQFIYVQF